MEPYTAVKFSGLQGHKVMTYTERSGCGTLTLSDVGRSVQLAGWVDALRDHGEVIFIHLRDRSGIVQVVFSPEFMPPEDCRLADSLRSEFCICVNGRVARREHGTENPHIETGLLEVIAGNLIILSRSRALPFSISEKAMVAGAAVRGMETVGEELRLRYRYLDLRRPSMQEHIIKRHRINRCVREYLDQEGFIEVETPLLTRSTPEGARDYLVPSRVHPKKFYALPQSPQLFKQLLMIGGLERYYQLARCFRDEDLRPNRQPEFTQLDLEASFVDEEFICRVTEELIVRMFAVGGITLSAPFPRMTWQEAVDTTGSDSPDLRFGLRLVEMTDILQGTTYEILQQVIRRGGIIKGTNIKGQSDKLSKNVLQNEYAKKIVPSFGARGMTWMRMTGGRLESNIVQFFSEEEQRAIIRRLGAEDGDVLVMIADISPVRVNKALGLLRLDLAGRLGLISSDRYCPAWITGFPLFEIHGKTVTSTHHPFTAPDRVDFDPRDRAALAALKSRSYDIVINGEEIGGGSIRISDIDVQHRIFQALGLAEDEIKDKFGFFLRSLRYGAPPHGGLAIGMDRVVSMILGTASIRDVIAFPKNRSASCPLTEAPSPVSERQLAEAGLLEAVEVGWVDGTKVVQYVP